MSRYRNNHYVPIWYQERFISAGSKENKYHYLDLRPDVVRLDNGRTYKRKALLHWGPPSCFCEEDLYTTAHGQWLSTEIEEKFFGPLDDSAKEALDYFANFTHPSVNGELFKRLTLYMSIQKLRTPKGLLYLSKLLKKSDKNAALFALQELQMIFCALWTECVWSIVDASSSRTKFIVSDHPVTVYNQGAFPASSYCANHGDPDIWLSGTHTLFPLSMDKLLLLTNLSWVRYPYGNPLKARPNPDLFRGAVFNFTAIQTGRQLSEREVTEVNYIIKSRARRYIAAAEKEWLYPEKELGLLSWNKIGESYLLMPDPRSMSFSNQIVMGFEGGGSDAFDAYGRKPWQSGYDDKSQHDREWETFLAFQGEFARRFGPRRRGRSFEFSALSAEVDPEDYHKYHLGLEQRHKKYRYK